MCGIAGIFDTRARRDLREEAGRMTRSLLHRGPDDEGVWSDPCGIALGHRRLAVVDLSTAGHQPMLSAHGRFVLAFNGEIYNHRAIRGDVEGTGAAPAWRGHSDTETLLAAFEVWGVEATLRRTVGMFALAVWDSQERTLHLARDRFGEKPLYYGWSDGAFLFGSELKAIRAFGGFGNHVCSQALEQYLRLSYVPAPRSIYRDVYKLEPGCILSVRGCPPAGAPSELLVAPARHEQLSLRRWWSLNEVVDAGARSPISCEAEAIEALEHALSESVGLQCLADVPLGAFLSGGIDSTLIVAMMQAQATRPVKTFTVGFEEAGFDESPHARAVAAHLGTEHTELFVTAAEARAVIPQLPQIYDEPFADSSQIPTHLVCRAARSHVTVALSGDGGDELFAGYNRYLWAPRIWKRVGWVPYPMRHGVAGLLKAVAPSTWDRVLGDSVVVRPGEKIHKLAGALRGTRSLRDLYQHLVSTWDDPRQLLQPVRGASGLTGDALFQLPSLPARGTEDSCSQMMYWDSLTYLPDDILCKVDRAAMALSLETRVPFLDHRVAELAWRLPPSLKMRRVAGKLVLRKLLDKHVPSALMERPKSGFALPVGRWLGGPLREWAESLLDPVRLAQGGLFNPDPIRTAWRQHLSGAHDWTPRLWTVLMFQSWIEGQT